MKPSTAEIHVDGEYRDWETLALIVVNIICFVNLTAECRLTDKTTGFIKYGVKDKNVYFSGTFNQTNNFFLMTHFGIVCLAAAGDLDPILNLLPAMV